MSEEMCDHNGHMNVNYYYKLFDSTYTSFYINELGFDKACLDIIKTKPNVRLLIIKNAKHVLELVLSLAQSLLHVYHELAIGAKHHQGKTTRRYSG